MANVMEIKKYKKKECINGIEIISAVSEQLTEPEHQEDIRNWIKKEIVPNLTDKINKKHVSYGLKHMCEQDLGFYVSNYDIKYNMCMLGIEGKKVSTTKIEGNSEHKYLVTILYSYPISEEWFKSKGR